MRSFICLVCVLFLESAFAGNFSGYWKSDSNNPISSISCENGKSSPCESESTIFIHVDKDDYAVYRKIFSSYTGIVCGRLNMTLNTGTSLGISDEFGTIIKASPNHSFTNSKASIAYDNPLSVTFSGNTIYSVYGTTAIVKYLNKSFDFELDAAGNLVMGFDVSYFDSKCKVKTVSLPVF